MRKKPDISHTYWLYSLAGGIVVVVGFLGMWIYDQYQQIKDLEAEQVALTAEYRVNMNEAKGTIALLETELDTTRTNLNELADNYENERDRNEDFEDQIRDLAGTLDDFEKLNKIDEELLSKYSKVYFLNENYVPSRLKKISSRYVFEKDGQEDEDHYFHADAMEYLEDLLDRARREDHDLRVISAYRSFDHQHELKGQFTSVYGDGANAFSADQGYSEHQLGTTVDLTIPDIGGTYQSFAGTDAYQWLEDNAYKYGFILSYPEGNDFYIYEPWHWRFVGRDLARYLHRDEDETFYTMEQRDINEYLLELFD